MRPRQALLLLLLLALPALRATAQQPAGAGDEAAGSAAAEAAIAGLLELFEANYRPEPELLDAAWQVEAFGRQAEREGLPSLTFTERAAITPSGDLDLELDLSAALPLYRARSEPLAELQAARRALLASETALVRADARSGFVRDLLSLALLRELEEMAGAALRRVEAAGWRAPSNAQEALLLPVAELDLLSLHATIQELHGFAEAQLPSFERRAARALGGSEAPPLPSFGHLEAWLLGAPPGAADDPAACRLASPLVEQARLRHRELELERAVSRTPDLRVTVQGSAAYRRSAAPAPGGFSGSLSLEALLPLPAASPVAGQVGLGAHLTGVEQTLRLSWPPPARLSRPVDEAELAQRAAHAIEAVAAELAALRRGVTAAVADVAAAETRLLLAARDLLGAQGADVTVVRGLAHRPAPDPVDELKLVQLRAEFAFARLTRAERLLDLRLLCGDAP